MAVLVFFSFGDVNSTLFGDRDVGAKDMMAAFLILPTLIAAATLLFLCGCASTPKDEYDEKEYSDMPWNTPQQWEGSRQIPGMGGGGGGGGY